MEVDDDLANARRAETDVKVLRAALRMYRLNIGSFPTTDAGLAALLRSPEGLDEYWRGPYIDEHLPLDPWGRAYRYESPVDKLQGFYLYSLGADGEQGGSGNNADIGCVP